MPRRDLQGHQVHQDFPGLWDYQADKDQGDDQDLMEAKDHEETKVHLDHLDPEAKEARKDQTQKLPE